MRMYDILHDKRDGKELTDEQIQFFVDGIVSGEIPDYQISAMLMAISINGMSKKETVKLTLSIANSGEMVNLDAIHGIKVDKHSTGGVGDKTTVVVAPIVAACGVSVAKMSGRGLGHTGGTIDKLESIQGFKTDVSREKFVEIVNSVGVSIVGQSGNLTPADKKMYALRDVTATVDSIPLIVSSIMGKKIAAGADAIVLDVKVGSGSFIKSKEYAVNLAKQMVLIGKGAGRKVTALLTNMDSPLGYAVGNSLEIIEAIKTLHGNGPDDLTELCLTIAANMLHLAKKGTIEQCRDLAKKALFNGTAFRKFVAMVEAQGGNSSPLFDTEVFPAAPFEYAVLSEKEGFVGAMDTEKIGVASLSTGAGRATKDDKIDYLAGIILEKKTGDFVAKGEKIATLYSSDKAKFEEAASILKSAYTYFDQAPPAAKLIIDRLSSEA